MRKNLLWLLALILAAALAVPAFAQGKGGGKPSDKGKPAEAGKDDKGKDKEKDKDKSHGNAFGSDDEKKIRAWFSSPQNLQGLPPGLAKREQLPPGLQKQLERNGTLPPGLQKRVQPLPASLEKQLPKLPDGRKRIVLFGNVILLEERTSKIIDILKHVIK